MKKTDNKYASPFDRKARYAGGIVTVGFHVLLLGVTLHTGFKYLYPPPPEQGILLEEKPVSMAVEMFANGEEKLSNFDMSMSGRENS